MSLTEDRGSVAILVALALLAFLGFSALVVDVGMAYAAHAKLQNALDAAALAGAQSLPQDPNQATVLAEGNAAQNGVSSLNVSFAQNNQEIIVSGQASQRTFFAAIWGITSLSLGAVSKAMAVPPTALQGLVPLSIEQQTFVYGQTYTLKSGAGEGDSGWYGAVQLSGPGASIYEEDLMHGCSSTVHIGDILSVQHGNISGPTQSAISYRINEDGGEGDEQDTPDHFSPNAPNLVYVPVVNVVDHSEVEVVGFAAFLLNSVQGEGNDSVVTGSFVQTHIIGGADQSLLSAISGEEQSGNTGYGLYTLKLLPN